MATLTVRLPGAYEDVHPYMGFLFAYTRDNRVVVFDWQGWVESVAGDYDNSTFLRWALGRNDLQAPKSGPVASREVDLPAINEKFMLASFDPGVRALSDWLIYNRTMYLAGVGGVWMVPLLINGSYDRHLEPELVLDAPSVNLRARAGVLAAACGEDGLFAQRAYLWDDQLGQLPDLDVRYDSYIMRSAWMVHDLIAFSENDAILFENSTSTADIVVAEEGTSRRFVEEFGRSQERGDGLFASPHDFESGFASNASVYAWRAGRVERFSLDAKRLTGNVRFELPVRTIYSGATFMYARQRGGFVLDSDRGTWFSDALHVNPELVSPGENIVVRVFPSAKYYQHQVWSVKADYVEVTMIV